MNTRLNYIQNWTEIAEESKWKASTMAERCDVSMRTLERHFIKHLGRSPKLWLVENRQQRAFKLLRCGRAVKEVALSLGYRHPNQFSRDFKRYWGRIPTAKAQSPCIQ